MKKQNNYTKKLIKAVSICGMGLFCATLSLAISEFGAKGEDGLDYIILLGSKLDGREPGRILTARIDKACDYLKRNPKTLCIVSGGKGENEEISEAYVMKRELTERGIEGGRIITESRSVNTATNIAYSKRFIGKKDARVGILSSNYHVYRGLAIARRAGFADVCGIAAPSVPLYLPYNLCRECAAIVKDFLAGNL